jgi:hypothetical protein
VAARRDRSRRRQRQRRGFRIRPAVGPSPATVELWCDTSNWTKDLTDQGCADLKAAGIVGVIAQAITGLDGISYTRQQLDACVRNGLRIAGYVWCFPHDSRASMSGRLQMFDGFAIETLWLDVEQNGLKRTDVDGDLALCDAYKGAPTGIYSGRWFFVQQGWQHDTWWSSRPLWDSNYTGVAEVGTGFVPYGGWTMPTMSQYRGTSTIGHVNQIDLDVKEGTV